MRREKGIYCAKDVAAVLGIKETNRGNLQKKLCINKRKFRMETKGGIQPTTFLSLEDIQKLIGYINSPVSCDKLLLMSMRLTLNADGYIAISDDESDRIDEQNKRNNVNVSISDFVIETHEGSAYIDSRNVAKVIGKEHNNLLRDIREYVMVLEKTPNTPTELKIEFSENSPCKFVESNLRVSNFFVESSYKDATGRELPCYLVTKMGCEMIAHKLTGNRGVWFTAIYVQRFHEMTEAIEAQRHQSVLQAFCLPDSLEKFSRQKATALLFEQDTPPAHKTEQSVRYAILDLIKAIVYRYGDNDSRIRWRELYCGVKDGFGINIISRPKMNFETYLDLVQWNEWFALVIQAMRMCEQVGINVQEVISEAIYQRFTNTYKYFLGFVLAINSLEERKKLTWCDNDYLEYGA